MVAAITAACQVKMRRMPKFCSSQAPTTPWLPITTSR